MHQTLDRWQTVYKSFRHTGQISDDKKVVFGELILVCSNKSLNVLKEVAQVASDINCWI